MNTKRIIFWMSFIGVLGLILWGLVVAMNKAPTVTKSGTPAVVTDADHIRGSADASVTLIEYSDFECPACAAYHPVIEKLLSEATTSVRFVYRHFPLYPLPHKNAFMASQAAVAASLQGKYWDMHALIFENQSSWAGIPTTAAAKIFEGYATRLGLDVTQYAVDVDSDAVKARVQRDRDDGDAIGVRGTPTFFVNGVAITNPQNYEAFKKIIEDAALVGTN